MAEPAQMPDARAAAALASFLEVLDEGETMEEQPVALIVNVASRALQAAAYWRGRSDGSAPTIAYLKDRLEKAEARIATLQAEAP